MIFEWADVGIVGDWREVLEALTPRLAASLIR
jgi:electron transfer flavoprotein alpha subunit